MMTLLLGLLFLPAAFASDCYTISSSDLDAVNDVMRLTPLVRTETLSVIKMNENQVVELSGLIHERLGKCGGIKFHQTCQEAMAKFYAPAPSGEKSLFGRKLRYNYTIDRQERALPALELISGAHIASTVVKLSRYPTRFYQSRSGVESSEFIRDLWKDLTSHRNDVAIELIRHRYPQPSVILTIKGAKSPDDIVILGGHSDSIAFDRGKSAPGADDNASGIASMTEVLRVLMLQNYRPEKTIQLIAYAAEEVGLLGSQEITKNWKKAKKNVVGVLQLDMTLFKGTEAKDIYLISDETSREQNTFIGALIDEYVKVPWGYSACGYGCSDHASWTDAGFPASFPFESKFEDANPHIHTQHDTLENAGGDASHAVKFAKLAAAFLIELAK